MLVKKKEKLRQIGRLHILFVTIFVWGKLGLTVFAYLNVDDVLAVDNSNFISEPSNILFFQMWLFKQFPKKQD